MSFPTQKTKLVDCQWHGPGSELLVVEGDSASKSVTRLRNADYQAVLPMQGKPMNALKNCESAVRKNIWYAAFMEALGVSWDAPDIGQLRYERVLLLFDPDADGIHCGALMLIFIDTYLRPLIDAHRVSLIKPPLFQVNPIGYDERLDAFGEEHFQRIKRLLNSKRIQFTHQRYRGLASINEDVLLETCLNPESRTAYLLRHQDAVAAKAIFGGDRRVNQR